MGQLKTLETKLGDLYKDAPALPKKAKDFIVQYVPYLALLAGVLQLWGAYVVWRYMDRYGEVSDFVNQLSQYYNHTSIALSNFDKTILYVGIVALVVEAVVLLMAFSPLQQKARRGWDLLFLVSVLQVAYAVLAIFMHGYGIGNFIGNLIGAAIGFYFLFQIRSAFTKKA